MAKDVHSEAEKEEVSAAMAKDAASAATDRADHSLKVGKEDHHSVRTAKEEALIPTDHADHSLRVEKEDHHSEETENSLVREGHSVTESQADSETQPRRASTEMISAISVTRTKAESTR